MSVVIYLLGVLTPFVVFGVFVSLSSRYHRVVCRRYWRDLFGYLTGPCRRQWLHFGAHEK